MKNVIISRVLGHCCQEAREIRRKSSPSRQKIRLGITFCNFKRCLLNIVIFTVSYSVLFNKKSLECSARFRRQVLLEIFLSKKTIISYCFGARFQQELLPAWAHFCILKHFVFQCFLKSTFSAAKPPPRTWYSNTPTP